MAEMPDFSLYCDHLLPRRSALGTAIDGPASVRRRTTLAGAKLLYRNLNWLWHDLPAERNPGEGPLGCPGLARKGLLKCGLALHEENVLNEWHGT